MKTGTKEGRQEERGVYNDGGGGYILRGYKMKRRCKEREGCVQKEGRKEGQKCGVYRRKEGRKKERKKGKKDGEKGRKEVHKE
jgi:hypothetical protein